MKKLLILFSIVLITFMISCSDQNYYDQMTLLDPPEQMIIDGENVWITYEKELNENEILYFAPRSLKTRDQVYLNNESNYYIYTIKPSIFQFHQFRIAKSDDLKEIFG